MHQPPLILIVDDNDANRDIFAARLSANGYAIIEAADGEQALLMARRHRPDLLLLDVMMPKLDGFEVCRRLKADPAMPFTPIILVTAKADEIDVVAGLEAGADEYLTKPVSHKALVARVAAMLRVKAIADRGVSQPSAKAGIDIFVSYSRHDQATVGRIVSALEGWGWTVWWDRHLEAGAAFDRVIEDAIAEAKAVVVVWSVNSVGSDWVRAEAVFGLERDKLVPVRIDQSKLPLRFTQTHTLDLTSWDDGPTSPAPRLLLDHIGRAIGQAS